MVSKNNEKFCLYKNGNYINMSSKWVVCQIGAREYYIIPRILQTQDKLQRLYTDVWFHPKNIFTIILGSFISKLSERNDISIDVDNVRDFTPAFIFFELGHKFMFTKSWKLVFKRNHWFQKKVMKCKQFKSDCDSNNKPIVFGYSYAALNIFKKAKEKGQG